MVKSTIDAIKGDTVSSTLKEAMLDNDQHKRSCVRYSYDTSSVDLLPVIIIDFDQSTGIGCPFFENKIMIASVVFYCIHILGMLWTDDLAWGLHMLHKMWYFILFFPILFNIVSSKYVKYYLLSFLLAISITELLSYLVWFEIIPPFKNATVANPTPFMSHISYNPILAISIYLVAHQLIFRRIRAYNKTLLTFQLNDNDKPIKKLINDGLQPSITSRFYFNTQRFSVSFC
mgnify:CR=1 FL=1